MTGLIEWLEELAQNDRKVTATLRKSLSFDLGAFNGGAMVYVEPFLKEGENNWRREVFYLVAGLWASHWKVDMPKEKVSIAQACKLYIEEKENGSASIEKRFISVLNADSSQLPYHLRQLVLLLKKYPIDFKKLLEDLPHWNDEKKWCQNAWAREFYRTLPPEQQKQSNTISEII